MYSKRLISIIAAAVSATAITGVGIAGAQVEPSPGPAGPGAQIEPTTGPVVAIPVGPCQLAAQLHPGANIVTGGRRTTH
jgi:hypothetical protein